MYQRCAVLLISGDRFNRIQDNNKGDPLYRWEKKRKGWIKLHASVDINHVNAQKIAITSAHKHDAQILPLLVTGKEDQVFADKAYDSRRFSIFWMQTVPMQSYL